jgi:glycine cleavage system aminomethyltransferase T
LRGLRLGGQALPKKADKLYLDEKEVGYITSAIHSPMLTTNIALAYVRREHNAIGTELTAHSGPDRLPARIVPLPFV